MFTVHVISDIFLKFNEFTPESELNIPDVDLVILNGNLANISKRGMLYAEELCKKYPTTQFVYNSGFYELFPKGVFPKSKYKNEILSAHKLRSEINENWPKNLHYFYGEQKFITLRNGSKIDVFCTFGYPKILSYSGKWEETVWHKNIIMDITVDITDPRVVLPEGTSRVKHGDLPIWATRDWINEQNKIEEESIRQWELDYNDQSGYKILVTHINPVTDTRCQNQIVDFFNIHLNKGLWIGSNTKINNTMYLGAKFVSNPGRGIEARSLIITANT